MNTLFALSYIVLWLVVILFGAALFVLYSHVGKRLILDTQEGHRLQGPELAKPLERHVVPGLSGFPITIGGSSPLPRLLIYVSVNCDPCRVLLRGLPQLVEAFGHRVETILVCRGELADVRAFAAAVPNEVVVCADEQGQLIDAYRILRTPYALSLDRDGTLRYKGVPGADLESLSHFVVPLVRDEMAASTGRSPKVAARLSTSHSEFATANATGDI
jgi:hypothetical protein